MNDQYHAPKFRGTLLGAALVALATLTSGCISGPRARCCPQPRSCTTVVLPQSPPASEASADPRNAATTRQEPSDAGALAPQRAADEAAGRQYVLYDGVTGQRADLAQFLRTAAGAPLVAFGELHGDAVGSAAQLDVLRGLAGQKAPLALAMEFLERDTQAVLDAYLAGSITEEKFVKEARQNAAYPKTHRPLIEFCKANKIPVIAANAPRRLVTAYRKSGESYADYLASLSSEDRGFLPAETTILDDRHQERFMGLMGGDRGKRLFKSMSLWDDAMGEAVARFQDANPKHRVLLIAGAFHVTEGLGTVTKYLLRRPDAKVRVLVMSRSKDPSLPFEDPDKKTGDVVLKVLAPVKQ